MVQYHGVFALAQGLTGPDSIERDFLGQSRIVDIGSDASGSIPSKRRCRPHLGEVRMRAFSKDIDLEQCTLQPVSNVVRPQRD